MRHPVDTAVMSVALWLLAAMLIDVLTPKDLSVYVIGAVLAPAMTVGAVFYHWKLPRPDLAITLATLWMASVMAIEWVTPQPMSHYFMAAAVAPLLLVGGWLHGTAKWRRGTTATPKKSV
jgi:hypothetical protein